MYPAFCLLQEKTAVILNPDVMKQHVILISILDSEESKSTTMASHFA